MIEILFLHQIILNILEDTVFNKAPPTLSMRTLIGWINLLVSSTQAISG